MGDVTKMAGAFRKKHYVDPSEFRQLQRVIKSGRFRPSGATTKGLLGEGSVRTIVNPEQIQGTSKRLFPGCENMWWKNCFCLPEVGKQNATFSTDFTQPGKSLLEVPCIVCAFPAWR